ncbi:response regulator [Noviherbaspirillum denitrificans]|uniref:FimV domain-containing protein n=1 Tax=Noviherbaspirillum denitrificans TaxID=1968433 RepID=A0A254TDQ1_9BURK|nr:response regulator [Noviherbaspirillum denitrificans]OWW20780.1 FimV domain-containing protein [Noviherbaspirillum denitrificans]
MSTLRSLTALIVEPQSGMRANLHNMLNLCGITKIDHAVSSGTAIRPLKNKSYDLIICEYDLGEGQDGQQLLEDLRHNKLIPLWTIFIIVTAERAYEKVVSAAELAPNDYILKPFTADNLLDRIARAIEKRTAFLPAYHLMEHGNLLEAIDICRAGEAKYPRYAIDFLRLRAELHVILGEAAEAEKIYQELLQTKAVAWARLGLAKTLFMQGEYGDAEALLQTLVEESSKYMDAYDWLAKTHEAMDQLPKAKEVLNNAVAISPHAVRRLRKLGDIALETGDVDTAEKSFQKVVTKAKYSEFRDPEDHVRLVRTLVKKGDTQQASSVIRDMEKSLGNLEKTPACRALSSALVQKELGNDDKVAEELAAAVAACRDTAGISNDLRMELARNCLEHAFDNGAAEVMRDVMSNAADDAAMSKAMNVFEKAGKKELAETVVKESRRQVVDLVSSGAEKARQGDYQGAVQLMTAAVHKLPDNPQVVFNAAVAVLKYLENIGWEGKLGDQVKVYIESARRLDPNNPRLVPLTELYQNILKKYGVKPPGAN